MATSIAARRLNRWVEPEDAFLALRRGAEASFWLDSSRAEPGLARYSYLGTVDAHHGSALHYRSATRRWSIRSGSAASQVRRPFFPFVEEVLASHSSADLPFAFQGGLIGYLGYELKGECGAVAPYLSRYPDAAFLQVDSFAAFDHELRQVWVVGPDHFALDSLQAKLLGAVAQPLPIPSTNSAWDLTLAASRQQYLTSVARSQQWIREGESYELCLTNRLDITGDEALEPLHLYRHLRRENPAPYAAFLDFGDFAVLSSSPERFLQISSAGEVETKPIKGTRRRGETPEEDARLKAELASAVKDRSENLMITDLLRNDLGRVCQVGSIHVPKLMDVETYTTVHQLVSTIRGQLRPDRTALDCIRAAFPGGSMTGAPKQRSMNLLDELERAPRGVYSGAIGYLSYSGAVDLSIAIRTIVAEQGASSTHLSLGTGGAIVALSESEAEFEETLLKLRAQLGAFTTAVSGKSNARLVDPLLQGLRHHGHQRFQS